jgi:phage gp36-like protein
MPTPYATVNGLVAAFGERQIIDLTDIGTPRTDTVDAQVAQQACDRANVEVDANVLTRYAAPLGALPQLLVSLALDLAHLYLYQSEPPKWVQQRFDQAQANLKAVRLGQLVLGLDAAGATVQGQATDLAEMSPTEKVWGRESI